MANQIQTQNSIIFCMKAKIDFCYMMFTLMDTAQVDCVTFDQLPIEILHQIAQTDELTYRAMLAIPAFARSITIGKILDFMELFGHTVNVIHDSVHECHCIEWRRNGLRHRLNEPARIYANGDQFWYLNDKLHRLNEPAAICVDGTQHWYQNNKHHRLDGPAVIGADGGQMWLLDGKKHRSDGPAVIDANGDQCWYQDGKRHRLDGPAIIFADGDQYWYLDGKKHRSDGPAIIKANGDQEWWENGIFIKMNAAYISQGIDSADCAQSASD